MILNGTDRKFIIEHITPKADEAENEKRMKIEEVLFDIFSKYDEPAGRMDEEGMLRQNARLYSERTENR